MGVSGSSMRGGLYLPGGVVGGETAFSHHHARAVSSSLRTPRRHDAHVGRTAELRIMKHSCRRMSLGGVILVATVRL